MTLSQETLATVIHELAASVARAGFRRLVLFNSHGGNAPVLDYLARDVREATGLMVFHLPMFRTGLNYPQIDEQEARWGTHAGEWETSMMLALTPELVQLDRLEGKGGLARFHEPEKHEHVRMLGPVMFAWSTHDITATGAIGEPAPRDARAGSRHRRAHGGALCRDPDRDRRLRDARSRPTARRPGAHEDSMPSASLPGDGSAPR